MAMGTVIIIAARRNFTAVVITALTLFFILALAPTTMSTIRIIGPHAPSADTLIVVMQSALLLCGSMCALIPIAKNVQAGRSITGLKVAAIAMLGVYLSNMLARHIYLSIRANYDLVQQISILPILVFITGWIILAAGTKSHNR